MTETVSLDWHDYRQIHDTMQAHHVLWCEWPHDLEFLASIYGQHEKMKHLSKSDPLKYNQGDVLETIAVWQALDDELSRDKMSREVYLNQLIKLLPIVEESTRKGIKVNKPRVIAAYQEYKEKVDVAKDLVTAWCGFPLNIGSDDQLTNWLYVVEGMKAQKRKGNHRAKKKGIKSKPTTVNKDAIAALRSATLPFDPEEEVTVSGILGRIADGGHPVLEARVLYAYAANAISNYLKPLMVEE